jgi:hypothetical protein
VFTAFHPKNRHSVPGVAIGSGLWETVGMAKKRTKSDKALRQADQVEKRTEARPEQIPKKAPR